MHRSITSAVVLASMMAGAAILAAQTAAPPPLRSFLPIGRPANLPPSAVPDLSGDWALGVGGIGQSLSAADPGGRMRGKEPDIEYLPWALAKMMADVPPTGPDARFETNTDPNMHYCEPAGVGRIYNWPAKTRFVQTPEAVYLIHEVGPTARIVWLNRDHPEDPDQQYWGTSIGWYENGDTLVVDTIGFNDRTWLDQVAHPHTDRLHFIERYTKVSDTIEIRMTIDDPGAYAKPWPGRRNLRKSDTGFFRYQWPCSVRDNNENYQKVGAPGNPGATTFK